MILLYPVLFSCDGDRHAHPQFASGGANIGCACVSLRELIMLPRSIRHGSESARASLGATKFQTVFPFVITISFDYDD
jgi:hypothetical protein